MHRSLIAAAAVLVACGPSVTEPADNDAQWMLGAFSNIDDADDESEGLRAKLVLHADGTGDYVVLGCEGEDTIGRFVWKSEDNTAVLDAPDDREKFIVPSSEGGPFRLILHQPQECAPGGLEEYPADVQLFPSDPDSVNHWTFYRSDPCSGEDPNTDPPEDCPEFEECHEPALPCKMFWCEDVGPAPCKD